MNECVDDHHVYTSHNRNTQNRTRNTHGFEKYIARSYIFRVGSLLFLFIHKIIIKFIYVKFAF